MSMIITTPITELFSLQKPILQMPSLMPQSPTLIAQVANEGGLGVISSAFMSKEALQSLLIKVKEETEGALAIHILAHDFTLKEGDEEAYRAAIERAQPLSRALSLTEQEIDKVKENPPQFITPLEALDVAEAADIKTVIVSFGQLDQPLIEALKERDFKIIAHSTHMLEALLWEEIRADAHLLQSSEAGGLSPSFMGDSSERLMQSSDLLLAQGGELLSKPLIIAADLFRHGDFVAKLAQGAAGVALDSALLMSQESALTGAQKAVVWESNEYDSIVTEEWSGRLGRVLMNDGLRTIQKCRGAVPPFPIQHLASTQLLAAAPKAELVAQYAPLWLGANAPFCLDLSVKELFDWLVSGSLPQPEAEDELPLPPKDNSELLAEG